MSSSRGASDPGTQHAGPDRPPTHLVILSHLDDVAATVGAALARRLQRPFLDRTSTAALDATHGAVDRPVLDWYRQTLWTHCVSVIAAPALVLDETDPPTSETAWTVFLDDAEAAHDSVATDEARARRDAIARHLGDVRVDTGDRDVAHIVADIADEWDHRVSTLEA